MLYNNNQNNQSPFDLYALVGGNRDKFILFKLKSIDLNTIFLFSIKYHWPLYN